jgi:lysozyme family protein
MTHDPFLRALAFTLEWEGGYVRDPDDPGGETKYGISRRAYPDLDIASLTQERAAEIYRDDYWDAMNLDEVAEISEELAIVLFDTAVNVGGHRAAEWLQEAVQAEQDGIVGPETLSEMWGYFLAWGMDLEVVISRILLRRYAHYTALAERHEWARNYLFGWCRRTKALWEVVA